MSDMTFDCFRTTFLELKLYIRETIESKEPLSKERIDSINELLKDVSKNMLSLKRLLLYKDYVESLAMYPNIQNLFPPYHTFLDTAIKNCSLECRYMLVLEKLKLLFKYVHLEETPDIKYVRDSLTIISAYSPGYRQLVEFLRLSIDNFQVGINNRLKELNLNLLSDIVKCFLIRIKNLIRQDNKIGDLLMLKSFVPFQLALYDKYMKSILSDVLTRLNEIKQTEEENEIRKYIEEKAMTAKIDDSFYDPDDLFCDPYFIDNLQL